jgi:2-polyprenyl-6-methoxyphenol hydroxylase-like FAD-dependent oxidoreductase
MRAVVVGGGVAGPVAALALQRIGVDVVVHESHPLTDGERGSWFTVTPNGLDALDAVGALHLARAIGHPTRTNIMRSATGHELGRLPLGAPLPDGTPALTMKRTRLAAALAQECSRRGIEVRYASGLTAAEPTASGTVRASFAGGLAREADLLVGADGVHSTTRRLIDPGAPAGRYVGLVNFGGFTPCGAGSLSDLEAEAAAWHFVFGRRAFFGWHATPSGDVVWFANEPRAQVGPDERTRTTEPEWRARLAELFAGDAGPAAELIRNGVLELAGDNTHDLAHVPSWHRGPMIVIGDAAHAPAPSSGQGASIAMEDGVVLAQALRDSPDVPSAFATYEGLRRARVERIVAAGARSSSSKAPRPLFRPLRDAALRLAFRHVVTEPKLAWMYDHRIDWEKTLVPGAR